MFREELTKEGRHGPVKNWLIRESGKIKGQLPRPLGADKIVLESGN